MKTTLRLIGAALCALMLAGCAGHEAKEIAGQGNAQYKILCPVVLPDGNVATYIDEEGKVRPVMAEYSTTSGRVTGGDITITAPGCLTVDIKGGLQQGEERTGALQLFGGMLTTLVGAVFGIP